MDGKYYYIAGIVFFCFVSCENKNQEYENEAQEDRSKAKRKINVDSTYSLPVEDSTGSLQGVTQRFKTPKDTVKDVNTKDTGVSPEIIEKAQVWEKLNYDEKLTQVKKLISEEKIENKELYKYIILNTPTFVAGSETASLHRLYIKNLCLIGEKFFGIGLGDMDDSTEKFDYLKKTINR